MTKVNNGLVMGAFSHNWRVEFSTYYVRCRSPTLVERQPTHPLTGNYCYPILCVTMT